MGDILENLKGFDELGGVRVLELRELKGYWRFINVFIDFILIVLNRFDFYLWDEIEEFVNRNVYEFN